MTGTLSDVELAVRESVALLAPHTGADWSVPAGSLTWSCRETAAHIAHDLLAYAGQVTGAAGGGYLPFDLTVHQDADPAELLRVITACGRLLGTQLAAADPADRAWHWGPTDPSGFAAMGTAEVLLHTTDIAGGLGLDWRPPAGPSARVLERLFPQAPAGDPVDVLLWQTGRGELPGRERLTSWVWKAALND
ncbi:maleylpyruvate isomerase N-terminal domain-containing protein [Kitasatospora viridis]|uniref:Mycothiol maleylpyruvate isomerase-like protein n=1 Tax=Kitasatospora viridis TaxID=281105 RepID=A0A561UPJ0_9ACTN|nr:maleylpyruvate isomerase N-terminal domain-containing protein [Kitasatospora viridis]TWG01272.1 mycothiol maleylpyruvate isomerase-like protein [Kitasatospora viridis]